MAQWKGEIKTICIVFDPEMKFGDQTLGKNWRDTASKLKEMQEMQ